MPSREAPSYSSSRVQRASRLNAIEQARLQHQLHLLEKAYIHQARLTNQDIRLTSLALEYIQACSGHSPEGRGPRGQPRVEDATQQEDPCFLYGERVVSRKVRRMARPHSAAVDGTAVGRRHPSSDASGSGTDSASSCVALSLPPRPQSSPARRPAWTWSSSEETDGSVGSEVAEVDRPASRATTPAVGRPGTPGKLARGASPPTTGSSTPTVPARITPHQAWEDDTDDVTRKLLRAQQNQQQEARRASRQHAGRTRFEASGTRSPLARSRGFVGAGASSPPEPIRRLSSSPHDPLPSRLTGTAIEDQKPVPPREKHARSSSAVLGRKAGLADIVNQARATMSASAWRAHLAQTHTAPSTAESQNQVVMEARKGREKERQNLVQQKVDLFIGQPSRLVTEKTSSVN